MSKISNLQKVLKEFNNTYSDIKNLRINVNKDGTNIEVFTEDWKIITVYVNSWCNLSNYNNEYDVDEHIRSVESRYEELQKAYKKLLKEKEGE